MRTTLRERSGEAKMIADTAADLTDEYDHEYWRQCVDEGRLPTELWDELAELGFLGITVPEEYGGQGLGIREQAALVETIASRAVTLPFLVLSSGMAPIPIANHGSEDLKERFLPSLARGETRFCFAITEPNAGTNSFRISTQATREGQEYVVNGTKIYISGVRKSDYIQLVTRTTPYGEVKADDPRVGGTVLIVPTEAPGITLTELDTAITGTTSQYEVNFDDVRVPVANRIGEEDRGFFHMFDALNPERILVGAQASGYGQFVLERAIDYAKDREVFDAPIGTHQAIQHPLTETTVDLELGGLALDKAVESFDEGRAGTGAYANMAKYALTEAADRAIDISIQTLGGNGLSRDYDVITLRNNIRLYRVAPVSNEMVLNHLAERMLGLPRSY